jgi:hypothetical protein
MVGETPAARPETVRTERTREEVVLRLPTLGRLLRTVLPQEAVEHMYAAQREQLLAVRAVLDAAIGRLEKAQHAEPRQKPQRTEIAVE